MKRALITGGSGDIGQAICRELAKMDIEVLVHANTNQKSADQVAKEILGNGGLASSVCFDITDQNATQKAIEQILIAGPIQILVNNAGVHDDAIFAGMGYEPIEKLLQVLFTDYEWKSYKGHIEKGYVMPAKEKQIIVSVQFTGQFFPSPEFLEHAHERVEIEVVYKSFYGDQFHYP